ncbi:MAG: FkbM family methyltransferase [Acidobacteriota bacterium]
MQLIFSLLGRRAAYRIGRALYQKARGEVANDMASNGETLVQSCVVDAWKRGALSGQRLVVFDVGANVGDWSSALLSLLADSNMREVVDLYAFEPVPSTFEFLRNRLGAQNPVLHYEQVALSSDNGEGVIYVSAPNAGTNSLHANSPQGDEQQIAIVRATATDFCKAHKIQKVQLLKCDAEGHDMEVIRGALPLLADEKISILQFEYNHRWVYARNFLRDAFASVEKLPYKLAKLQPDHLLIFTEWHPELERFFEGNYALVHMDALDWFPTKRISWDRYNTMCVERQ